MALVVEHHEEIEVDLLRQGIDLLDFWRGTLTARRLRLLISNLPRGSVTLAAVDPDGVALGAWSETDYLLADLFDITAKSHFQEPKPYPRPADVIRRRQREAKTTAFLAAQAERNRLRDLADSTTTPGG